MSQQTPGISSKRTFAKAYALLTELAAKRWLCLLLVLGILAVDVPFPWQGWSFEARALMDEPCHLATGLICLGAITRVRRRPPAPAFGWAMLIWSNLVDLDHLPQEFGSDVLMAGPHRPATHALWLVVVLALAAAGWWLCTRRAPSPQRVKVPVMPLVLLGSACGLADHLLRDIAYAPAPLWWPLTDASVKVPYWWYAVFIVVVALVASSSRRSRIPGVRWLSNFRAKKAPLAAISGRSSTPSR